MFSGVIFKKRNSGVFLPISDFFIMEKAVITFETILVGSFNFKIFSYLPVYNLLLCDNNGLTVREQCAV